MILERIPGTPPQVDEQTLEALALLYARVFAEAPWREYTTCSSEGVHFGTETQSGNSCPNSGCSGTLVVAHPPGETATHISQELGRPDAALFVLRDNNEGRIVGFSWGFSYSAPEEFAEAKYRRLEMIVAISGLLRHLGAGEDGLWYLSESGIEDNPSYRGRGWSRVFHTERLAVAQSLGLDAIQRTNCDAVMYRTSGRTMTQVMGPEAVVDPTGQQLVRTGKLVNNLVDTEDPSRVLFVKLAKVGTGRQSMSTGRE